MKQKRCAECGEGTLQYGARPGRSFEYCGFMYEIPAEINLVECPVCHAMPMTVNEVDEVETAVAKMHQADMSRTVDESLTVLQGRIPIGQLEKILRLSQGYLARARTKAEPSVQLTMLLKLLASDPAKLSALREMFPLPSQRG